MRMNIYIEGKQSDMTAEAVQRSKRCLNVLKDIGFDIKLRFSVPEEGEIVNYLPNYRPQELISPIKELNEAL